MRILFQISAFFGFKITPIISDPILLYDKDELFLKYYGEVKSKTLLNKERLFIIYELFRNALEVEGDVAEVGVYRGGTAKLLLLMSNHTNKNKFFFDTFSGMPAVNPSKDTHKEGDFNTVSLKEVNELLKEYKNVSLVEGIFPESSGPASSKMFCFVHIDVDIYQSVLDACTFFYPRMNKGGIMIFDDYGFLSCPGAKSAVDEFFFSKKGKPIYLATGQAFVIT